jgi:D-glycero-D-manno-heptose 1,7-bisphosphate phosphatase
MGTSGGIIRIVFSGRDSNASAPAIFIDRDGVINRRRANDYVLNWRQFVFIPGIREALKRLSTLHLPLIIISNQAAVGKGLLQRTALEEITARLHKTLRLDAASISACYYCPHTIEDCCDCRKPKSGMFRRAAVDFDIDLSRSIFVGDSETDVQAARSAGCQPILFDPEISSDLRPPDWAATVPVVRDAAELFDIAETCLHFADFKAREI